MDCECEWVSDRVNEAGFAFRAAVARPPLSLELSARDTNGVGDTYPLANLAPPTPLPLMLLLALLMKPPP